MSLRAITTDHAIFVYDAGDRNFVASMLKYGEENDTSRLKETDFRIVFFGTSIEEMSKEPFCRYPEKMISYKDLGICEDVNSVWNRSNLLSQESLAALSETLKVKKRVWTGVSAAFFTQVLGVYQEQPEIEGVAIRDNPSPFGDTDYFPVAEKVQAVAKRVFVPCKLVADTILEKPFTIIGHPPMEEWCALVAKIDKNELYTRLNLDPDLPIVVYAGVYGDFYPPCFRQFLDLLPDEKIQVLVAPHPKYKGVVEKSFLKEKTFKNVILCLIGTEETYRANTMEALSIANLVITADPTSTVVFQANALKKPVALINPSPTNTSQNIAKMGLLEPVFSNQRLLELLRHPQEEKKDLFEQLGMPKKGAKLLWEEFIK